MSQEGTGGTADRPRFVSGFAAIVGRPNVGKSTLLNAVVGKKLAIMSDKPQTTRNRIVGVVHRPEAQVVFMDTPGIHKPQHRLGEYMNEVAHQAIPGVDLVLYVVDGSAPVGEGDRLIASRLQRTGKPAILTVNKLDRIPRSELFAVLDAYKALGENWLDVVPVSALLGTNLQELLSIIIQQLPEGPQYYPEHMVTDQPERFVVAERIREKIIAETREEVPHSVAVIIEEMSQRPDGMVYVRGEILVERPTQKGILIGAGGQMLKTVGQQARADLETLLGSRIYLDLWVKVREDWRNRDPLLRSLGYRPES